MYIESLAHCEMSLKYFLICTNVERQDCFLVVCYMSNIWGFFFLSMGWSWQSPSGLTSLVSAVKPDKHLNKNWKKISSHACTLLLHKLTRLLSNDKQSSNRLDQ